MNKPGVFLLVLGCFILLGVLPSGVPAQPLPQAVDSVKTYKPCPKCKVANDSMARFCFSCGNPFEPGAVRGALPEGARADSSRAGLCPGCGKTRYPEAAFCSNCGASLEAGLQPPRQIESGPRKEPGLAFACSVILPGSGQIYNGEPGKGIVQFGLFGGGIFLTLTGFVNAGLTTTQPDEGSWMIIPGLAVTGLAWVWSVVDAPLSAGHINRRRGYTSLRSPGLGLAFVPDPHGTRPGLGLRAGF